MSGIHLKSRSVVLLLSLSAAVAVSALSGGCSSSDSDGGTAGESSGAAAGKDGKAGESSGGSGDEAGAAGETAAGGSSGGSAPTGGTGGSGDAGAPPGDAGAAGSVPVDPDAEAKQRAIDLIAALPSADRCTTCHQTDYSGLGFWPNITPDTTSGIGSWTDQEIKDAITSGTGPDGELCATMPRFPFTAAEVSDIVIYLRSLKPSAKKITSKCPT